MKIAILAAMKEELAPFRDFYHPTPTFTRGKCEIESATFNEHTILLVETGIGKVNAAFTTTLLCEKFEPDLIINTGSAGGFSTDLNVGDVIFANQLIYSDVDATAFDYADGQVPQMPAFYSLDNSLSTSTDLNTDYQVHEGLILTSDSFMSHPDLVNSIKIRFPLALASDMESTAIAQVAAFFHIPLLNIRGISDIAGVNAAETFDAELNKAATNAFDEVQKICQSL